jgi:hypothetical protein
MRILTADFCCDRGRAVRQKRTARVKFLDCSWAGSSMVEQLTLNQRVGGSSPPRLTKNSA